jgi:glycine cleavage system T protein (aminomethyltransferase)
VPRGTPFHSRTSALCESYQWRNWSGYVCASSYSLVPEMEYHAIRNSAGLIDVSPLFKYEIRGADALRLVNKVVTRDVSKARPGQILYTPWCDDRGKTLDDGTVWNLGSNTYRMTSAEPNLRWIEENAFGLDAEVTDLTEEVAALALQGPLSKVMLQSALDGVVETLKFYRFASAKIGRSPALVSRTGYTGDLGYEIWTSAENAEAMWDSIMAAGANYGITPAGLLALDISRIEAGFVLAEVDYMPSRKAMIDEQSYSPYELSLDWTVSLDKGPFTGRHALLDEARRGPRRRVVGLEIDWETVQSYFADAGLPPEPPHTAWRSQVPVYAGMRQVGKATSGVWSPLLKRYLAIATIETPYSSLGTVVEMEVTVEGVRKRAPATVVKRPFFDPPRKKG